MTWMARVGTAFIQVTPSFRGFRATTEAWVKSNLKGISVPVKIDYKTSKLPDLPAARQSQKVKVDADTSGAQRSIRSLESRLDRLTRGRFLVNIGVAVAPAAGALGGVGLGGAAAGAGIGSGLFAGIAGFTSIATASYKRLSEAQKANAQVAKSGGTANVQAGSQIASAERSVRDATRNVTDAQKAVERSLADLHAARRQAVRDLEDLREKNSDNVRSEEDAKIALEETRRELERVNRIYGSQSLKARRARLDVADAEDKLSDVRRQSRRDADDLAASERKGINGDQQVVRAREQVADAQQQVSRAREQVADARADLADTRASEAAAAAAAAQATGAQTQQLIKLSPAQQMAAKSADLLRTRWSAFQDRTDPLILGALSKGMDALGIATKPLASFIAPVAKAVGGFFDQLGRDAGSKQTERFAKSFGLFSGSLITDAGQGIRNLTRGFTNLLTAFMPLSTDMSGGLVKLTDRFAKWSDGIEKRRGFQKFVAFVRENGPLVVSTIGSIVRAVVAVAVALAPVGVVIVKIVKFLADMIGGFAQANPRVIQIAGAFLAASAAATAVGSVFAAVGRNALVLGRLVFGAGKIIFGAGKLVVLALRLIGGALLTNPIGLIITALVLLGVGLVVLYKKSETFRRIVNAAFHAVQKVVGAVVGWIIDHWKLLGTILLGLAGPVGWITLLVIKNFDKVKGAVGAVGRAFGWLWKNAIKPAFKFIGDIIGAWWSRYTRPIFSAVGNWLADRLPGAFRVIRGVARVIFKAIGGYVSVWWKVVSGVFRGARKGVGLLGDAFRGVKAVIKRAWSGLSDFLTKPISAAVSAFRTLIKFYNKIAAVVPGIGPINLGGGSKSRGVRGGSYSSKHPTQGGRGRTSALRMPVGGKGGKSSPKGKNQGAKAGASRVWPANTKQLSPNYPGHSGVDIAAAAGTPIKAAASGIIDYVGWGRGYGQAIFERFANGLSAVYGHTSKTFVRAGQKVSAGQRIGLIGATGHATGPHLHFEINSPGPFGNAANRSRSLAWLSGASFKGGRGGGGGSSAPAFLLNPLGYLKGALGGLDKIKGSPIGNMLFGLASAIPGKMASSIFDQGGLATTAGMLMKPTVKPERVLSPQQTQAFERLAANGFMGHEIDYDRLGRSTAKHMDGVRFVDERGGSIRLNTMVRR